MPSDWTFHGPRLAQTSISQWLTLKFNNLFAARFCSACFKCVFVCFFVFFSPFGRHLSSGSVRLQLRHLNRRNDHIHFFLADLVGLFFDFFAAKRMIHCVASEENRDCCMRKHLKRDNILARTGRTFWWKKSDMASLGNHSSRNENITQFFVVFVVVSGCVCSCQPLLGSVGDSWEKWLCSGRSEMRPECQLRAIIKNKFDNLKWIDNGETAKHLQLSAAVWFYWVLCFFCHNFAGCALVGCIESVFRRIYFFPCWNESFDMFFLCAKETAAQLRSMHFYFSLSVPSSAACTSFCVGC